MPKKVFRSGSSVLPSFDIVQATTYFTNILKCVNPMKVFMIAWIPKLKEPNIPFNLSSPTYHEITRIIKHMKSSGWPCLLDQISIICFKRCSYLRSFILNICTEVLRSNTLAAQWTKAATIWSIRRVSPVCLWTSDQLHILEPSLTKKQTNWDKPCKLISN